MDEKEIMTPAETARIIGVTTQTLANWRARGQGPPYRKPGGKFGRTQYRRTEVLDFIDRIYVDPLQRGGGHDEV